jgi:hypothetical protein
MIKSAGFGGRAVWFAVMIWILGIGPVFAQQKDVTTVFTIGSSRIVGDDMSASRARAIDDGLVAAGYQVLSDMMPQEVLSTGFQAINEKIFAHTDNYINDYKVITESVHGDTHRLLIQAGVSVRNIKEALKTAGIWADQKALPRVLLCVAEKMVDELEFRYWWSGQPLYEPLAAMEALSQTFSSDQYVLLRPSLDRTPVEYPWDLDGAQAISLGRFFEADVVVAGVASAESTPNTMGGTMRTFRGSVTLKAFRVSDGKQIALGQSSALVAAQDSFSGGREALRNAAVQAGADTSIRIQEVWRSEGAGKFQLELRVAGIGGNMASFVRFRGALSTMSGVDSVQLKEMSTTEAVLMVAYQGNARSLADALLLIHFDTFGINISDVGINTIELQLTTR